MNCCTEIDIGLVEEADAETAALKLVRIFGMVWGMVLVQQHRIHDLLQVCTILTQFFSNRYCGMTSCILQR